MDIENMKPYMDDIGWSCDTVKECLDRFEQLLERCHKHNIKVAPDKVFLCMKEIILLGHRVHEGGVSPTEEKIAKIRSMRPPTIKAEIASFLGLVGYYQEYIERFQETALPLTPLKAKDVD